jgi:cytochrome c553
MCLLLILGGGNDMKKIVLLLALVAFIAVSAVAFANPAAPAGDLKVSEMMKSNKKPPVMFSHAKHAAGVPDCKTCHHTWDGKSAPEKCSKCHTGRKSGKKDNIKKEIPELPDKRKNRYINEYKLSNYDSSVLTIEKSISDYFDQVLDCHKDLKKAGKKAGPTSCKACHKK